MTETHALLAVLKRRLKAQGLTYKAVAEALQVSEPSVKRLFASRRLTVDRLVRLSALVGMTLAELTEEAFRAVPRSSCLTVEQETQLVADEELLLVAVCTLNHWSLEEILKTYRLSEIVCLKHLLHLDRMHLIQLLPGNRVRLMVNRDFDWLPDGPIRRYFRQRCQTDFLTPPAAQARDAVWFTHGMLSSTGRLELQRELARLRQKFAQLHRESEPLPVGEKAGVGLLLAARGWEPEAFRKLRRETEEGGSHF
ncbi:MAG: hypothetical protein RLZZ244_2533 [Verrucomicrobiota bacterium]